MIAIQRKRVRRLSVWTLIFSILLLTVLACLPAHASPVLDGVKNGVEQAKDSTENAVRDVTDGMEKADGTVRDGDGMLGNEQNEAPNSSTQKLGKVALLVLIAAVIIAIIMIVLLIPKRKQR